MFETVEPGYLEEEPEFEEEWDFEASPTMFVVTQADSDEEIDFDEGVHEQCNAITKEVDANSITDKSILVIESQFSTFKDLEAHLAWTEAPSVPTALVSMLLRLPNIKFVIATLGKDGCVMLQRSVTEGDQLEEMDADILLETLKQRKDNDTTIPTCISSTVTKFRVNGIGTVSGRLFVGTAEKIPPSELVDTTGAGDAFIGAVLYAVCASMPPEKMLPFAAQVAALSCRDLGARTGLPCRTDPRLASFL
ncbi:hypothetical protein HYC85_001923 [Camellia sinensis]|uniref:Carbohydrate kinase PfkB domain-containing protein n=1 Tax=Camellia sinensis TaxID=4442 RepID=A0A7J7I8J7_CAMSI|nr:hypothetical protein HYC85_001923 [Camellia sinensis]